MNMWLCTRTPITARKVIMAGEMARGFSDKPQPVQSWHVDGGSKSGIAEMKNGLQLQWRGWHNLIMTSLPCMNVRHSKVDRRGQCWKGESRVKFVDSEGRWEHCTFPSEACSENPSGMSTLLGGVNLVKLLLITWL